jgi:transporter family-2 protein
VEIVLVLVALAAGALLPVQAAANAMMRAHVGRPEWAAVVNFVVGLVALLAWGLVLTRQAPSLAAAARAPWWAWTGGLMGAFFVASNVVLVPRLGIATTFALVIAGQVAIGIALDHFGAMGIDPRPVSLPRVVGGVLLVAGVLLVRR